MCLLSVVDWFVLRNLLVIKAEFSDIDVGTMETVEVLPIEKSKEIVGGPLNRYYMISDPDYH